MKNNVIESEKGYKRAHLTIALFELMPTTAILYALSMLQWLC